jgi:mRNA-degrading endonuclease toxin of MazEF toxin-antitoxin module
MERGDIYIVPMNPTQGSEQQGTRPVLIVSPGPFNRLTGVPVVLPITQGGNFARTAGFAVSLMGGWDQHCRRGALRPAACARHTGEERPQGRDRP